MSASYVATQVYIVCIGEWVDGIDYAPSDYSAENCCLALHPLLHCYIFHTHHFIYAREAFFYFNNANCAVECFTNPLNQSIPNVIELHKEHESCHENNIIKQEDNAKQSK